MPISKPKASQALSSVLCFGFGFGNKNSGFWAGNNKICAIGKLAEQAAVCIHSSMMHAFYSKLESTVVGIFVRDLSLPIIQLSIDLQSKKAPSAKTNLHAFVPLV